MKVQSIASWLIGPVFRHAMKWVPEAKDLISAAGIDHKSLKEPMSRIPVARVEQCLNAFVQSSGKGDIGISWAIDQDDQYSVLHHLFLSASSLRKALSDWHQYYILQSDQSPPVVTTDSWGRMSIQFRHDGLSIQLQEVIIATLLDWCRQLVGERFVPEAIELAWTEPNYGDTYKRNWNVVAKYNGAVTRVVIGSVWLDKQLQQTNPHVMNMIQNEVSNIALKLSNRGSLSERIRGAIEQQRIHYNATQNEVAELFHISSRTLNRHLQHEGTSLKTILTELRIRSAKKLLEEGQYNIEQIAMKVGFSGRRTLDRIFIKHVGMSPAQYRSKIAREKTLEAASPAAPAIESKSINTDSEIAL